MTSRGNEGTSDRKPGIALPGNGSDRIADLKRKLGDEEYMAGAILRIATVLSDRLTEGYAHGGRATRG